MQKRGIYGVLVAVALAFGLALTPSPAAATGVSDVDSGGGDGSLRCGDTFAEFESRSAASVTQGSTTLFAGYAQVSGNNQNPIIASWTDGVQDWCRDDIEETGDDGRGYGLWWDGGSTFYALFTATGTQSGPNYTRWTGDGWMNSYGPGGGGRVTIVLAVAAATGEPSSGTYITARLTNGNSNSTTAQELDVVPDGNVIVRLNSAYSPRNVDKSRMSCSGDSGFSHWIEFNPTLTTAIGSTAERCVPDLDSDPPPNAPVPQYISRTSPANDESDLAGNLTLSWADQDFTDNFHVVLLLDNQIVLNEWYTESICNNGTCTTPALNLPNGTYSWWMAGSYTDTTAGITYPGHYDETTFIVGGPPPAQITTVAPIGVVNTPLPAFRWEPDPDAAWYQVYFSGPGGPYNSWFAAEETTIGGVTYPGVCGDVCEVFPEVSGWWLPNGNYTWYIQAWGPGGFGPWTQGDDFSLNLDAPSNLTIVQPEAPTAGTVTVSWQVAPVASWYELWVSSTDYGAPYHYEWHDVTSACAGNFCNIDVQMPAGEAIIWLRAWGPGGFSTGGEGGWYASDPFMVGN